MWNFGHVQVLNRVLGKLGPGQLPIAHSITTCFCQVGPQIVGPDFPGPNLPRTLSSSFHTLTEPNWNLLQITIDSQRFVEILRNPWDLQIMIVMIGMDNVYNIVIYSQT